MPLTDSGSNIVPLVRVSSIHVKSKKKIHTIALNAGDQSKEFTPGDNPEQFDPPLDVLFRNRININVSWKGQFGGVKSVSYFLDPKEISSGAKEMDGKQVYRKTEGIYEFTIGILPLPSSVDEVIGSCSRFRILVIGESGVGKTSLICRVFGVDGLHPSNDERGEASIDRELVAKGNDHFVIHDSCGFEAADRSNLNAIINFIADRKGKTDLKDQLHVVWVCLAIPYAGGRFMEAGVAEFLRRKDEILGNIPLVVLFTKLDLLVGMLSVEALHENKNPEDCNIPGQTRESLERLCTGPIQKAAGGENVPHVAVSVMHGYGDSLQELVNETTKNVKSHVENKAAYYMAALAQRVNV